MMADGRFYRLFEVFDTNKSGAVSLQEFVHGLSICLRGSHAEQSDCTIPCSATLCLTVCSAVQIIRYEPRWVSCLFRPS